MEFSSMQERLSKNRELRTLNHQQRQIFERMFRLMDELESTAGVKIQVSPYDLQEVRKIFMELFEYIEKFSSALEAVEMTCVYAPPEVMLGEGIKNTFSE